MKKRSKKGISREGKGREKDGTKRRTKKGLRNERERKVEELKGENN